MDFSKTKERIVTKTFLHKFVNADEQEVSESITFSFPEKCLTPGFFDAIARFQETRNASEIARHLSRNIRKWNLDWNSEPFPPSYDNLANVCDFGFLMELVNEMSASFSGNGQTPSESANGSDHSAQSEAKALTE